MVRAFDRGINYYDVAPSYGKGEAERKLGPALKPYRDQVFLACKTGERELAGATKEFENSLKTLQTDYFDLYQLHNMHRPDDIEKAFAVGGVMELMVKARDEGKIKYLGFSAHDEDVISCRKTHRAIRTPRPRRTHAAKPPEHAGKEQEKSEKNGRKRQKTGH